jgi:hypothetical protein
MMMFKEIKNVQKLNFSFTASLFYFCLCLALTACESWQLKSREEALPKSQIPSRTIPPTPVTTPQPNGQQGTKPIVITPEIIQQEA